MTTIHHGVIEDINDPLKAGRVRVRIFGLHTDDTNLIRTEDLPWSQVMLPVTSASMDGIGFSPNGLLRGSWVVLYFLDDDNQAPLVIGSIPGLPRSTAQEAADEEFEFSDNEIDDTSILRDSNGNPVLDSQKKPIEVSDTKTPAEKKQSEQVKPTVPGKVDPSKLGSVSARYESNGNPSTINKYTATGFGDLGGASYGAYQLASYLLSPTTPTRSSITQSKIANSPINKFVKSSSYQNEFAGLSPASPQFDAKWKEIGSRDSVGFLSEQHKYIERTYYQIASNKLPTTITNRGVAVHEAIWSRSVQLGADGAVSLFRSAIGSPGVDVCDSHVIDTLYTYNHDNVETLFASSPSLWNSLRTRFINEKKQLVALAKTYEGDCKGTVSVETTEKIEYKEDKKEVVQEKTLKKIKEPKKKGKRGFQDPTGQYPKRPNEPDTSRIARGIITGTATERKRNLVVTGKEAGSEIISEPLTQYNTKYPFNRVIVTECGHVFELDDTAGYERINIYHKDGSFIEMHPGGKVVLKAADSNHKIVTENDEVIIMGDELTSIEGNVEKTVGGNINLVVYGNVTQKIHGEYSVNAEKINLN